MTCIQKASSGAGNEELLLEDNTEKFPLSWSRDGKFIMYVSNRNYSADLDLFVLPLSGDRKPVPFLQTQFREDDGKFSPDGRWVAHSSDESGRYEAYVASFPGPGGKWQISMEGGTVPRWRSDGTEIFYVTPDNKLMAVAVSSRVGSFQVGNLQPLFEARGLFIPGLVTYDVSADGQRFLIRAPEQATAQLTVVLNWRAGLAARETR